MNQFLFPQNNGGTSGAGSEFSGFEQLEQSPELQKVLDHDFGVALEGAGDGFSRRRWLQLMGASLALGAAGCRYQAEQIVPYAFRPQNRIPGTPVRYATMIDFAGEAHPVEALSYDGRPIKLDGNRLHDQTKSLSENSPGTSTAFTQARILELYDPDRLRTPLKRDNKVWAEVTRDEFLTAFRQVLSASRLEGVAILAEPSSSPTQARLQKDFEARGGRWYTFTSLTDDNSRAGSKAAFERVVQPLYELDQARVIVCLDADPLQFSGGALRNNRLFAAGRDVDHADTMSRLYCVESEYSLTGAAADHRMSLPSNRMASFVGALAAAVALRKSEPDAPIDGDLKYRAKLLACMAQDLVKNAGAGVIMVGERQPPEVHAAVHRLNDELGNIGKTIRPIVPLDADRPLMLDGLVELQGKLKSGEIKTLVMLGGNPAYEAPADLEFGSLIANCPTTIHLSYYKNETSELCNWVFNLAHPLEAWGDGLAYDGSWCLAQPVINPLFQGWSGIELLASAMGSELVSGLELVKATAEERFGGGDRQAFESLWQQSLHNGFFEKSAAEVIAVKALSEPLPANEDWLREWDGKTLEEVVFVPSRSVYDGRFANNAWLQELPDFVTKITWDNAALVNPETAKALGLKQNTLVTLSSGAEIQVPVHIQPGQAKGSIAIALGYGRRSAGVVGGNAQIRDVGRDVAPLRTRGSWYINRNVQHFSTKISYGLAVIQENWEIDKTGRDEIQRRMFMDRDGNRSSLLREGSFASYQEFKSHQAKEGDHGHAAQDRQSPAVSGSLPILNSAALIPAALTGMVASEFSKGADDDHGHGDGHGHGGHHHWPTNFHEHKLFDLTPGVRMEYTADNPNHRNAWGMSIDLNKCTGCNACVVACQSENNIPVVGKHQVAMGREMHWMRLDRYFGDNLYNKEAADSDDKQIVHQPVACHHCENAPCETVCPVAATVHSSEGLNDMVYNRCIGTRYCGNNCPYKVRRYNYLNYSDAVTLLKYPNADKQSAGDRALQNLMMNPEVTIRSRGVMEKCSYCVQRIQNGKIVAKREGNRPVGANEITTACQDACPTGAIKFGDINHPESDVHAAHHNPRAYAMLSELNNVPRTKYLARVRNPHPALMDHDDRGPVASASSRGRSTIAPAFAE